MHAALTLPCKIVWGFVALAHRRTRAFPALIVYRRQLLRRYQDFDDMRAALALALWDIGKREEAETQWGRVDDIRYKNGKWLKSQRHWPPR